MVVPVFPLANAGVDLRDGVLGDALSSRVAWGVCIALVVGKRSAPAEVRLPAPAASGRAQVPASGV